MRAAVILFACLAVPISVLAQPLTPAFTFQGELADSGSPASGPVDLRFRLFTAPVGGSQVGATLAAAGVAVVNGRFTVSLDFGASAYAGDRRWLEVDVSPAGAGAFTTLSPRQELAAAPNASFAARAGTSAAFNNQPPSFYLNAANLTGSLADARLSANVPRLNTANTYTGSITAPSFVGVLTGNASSASTAASLNNQPPSFYLNAANLTGNLADARLSANIARLNAANTFGQPQTITTPITSADAFTINHIVDLNAADAAGVRSSVSFNGTTRVYAGFFDADTSLSGVGVYAQVLATTGPSRGVWGKAVSFGGHAGYFEGRGYFSGDVGLGTESPEARLHVLDGSAGSVTGSSNASAVFERGGNNYLQLFSPDASERGLAFGSPANSFSGGVYYTNAGGLNLRTGGNSTRLVVSSAGDVGIGTGTPAARLDVAGDIRTSSRVLAPVFANPDGQPVSPLVIASFDQAGTPIGVPTNSASVTTTGTGTWRLSFSGYNSADNYAVIITARGSLPCIGLHMSQSASGISIRTCALNGTPTAFPFNLVVYRLD